MKSMEYIYKESQTMFESKKTYPKHFHYLKFASCKLLGIYTVWQQQGYGKWMYISMFPQH